MYENIALYLTKGNCKEYLQENAVEIAVLFNILEHMFHHKSTNAKSSVWVQATQGHNIKSPRVLRRVYSTAHCSHHDIVIIC